MQLGKFRPACRGDSFVFRLRDDRRRGSSPELICELHSEGSGVAVISLGGNLFADVRLN